MNEALEKRLTEIFDEFVATGETRELYAEVRSNLTESVHDLMSAGKTESEAVNQAFSDMGDLTDVLEELTRRKNSAAAANLGKPEFMSGFVNETDFATALPLANHQIFELSALTELAVSYDSDNVDFAKSTDGKIHLLEYMNSDNPKFFASITETDEKLTLTQGARPLLFGIPRLMRTKIVLLLPDSNQLSLECNVGSGNVTMTEIQLYKAAQTLRSGNLTVSQTKFDTFSALLRSGNAKLLQTNAHALQLDIKSGNLRIDEVNSETLTAQLHSGNIKVEKATAKTLKLKSHSGNVTAELLSFEDCSASSHSGSVKLKLPADSQFAFDLATKSGNAKLKFSDAVFSSQAQGHLVGLVGTGGAQVKAEVGSGNVKVDSID